MPVFAGDSVFAHAFVCLTFSKIIPIFYFVLKLDDLFKKELC